MAKRSVALNCASPKIAHSLTSDMLSGRNGAVVMLASVPG